MTKYYVTMTWHDWPEGGSYGTVVEALCYADAETLCREEMAASLASNYDKGDQNIPYILNDEGRNWHLVDCFEVDLFIKNHSNP